MSAGHQLPKRLNTVQQTRGQWNFQTMQSHKYARQQASKLNLSLFIRLLLSLLLNPCAIFRVWLYGMENHFLCKGRIMKNAAKLSSSNGPCVCACMCVHVHVPVVDTSITKLSDGPLLMRQWQRLGHTANSCLWDGNMHYCAHVPRHNSLPIQIQHVFTAGGVPLWSFFACGCEGNHYIYAGDLQWLS